MKTKPNLLKVSLLVVIPLLFVVGISYFISERNQSTEESSANALLKNGALGCHTDVDCETGLSCVDYGGTQKACTNKNNYSYCDKGLKLCNTGLTCINSSVTGTQYQCTAGENFNICEVDATCKSGLTCVNTNGIAKNCTDKLNGSYCDKDAKQCSTGLSCVNNSVTSTPSFRCTSGANSSPCLTTTDCLSGLTCVDNNGYSKYCSNKEANSYCDKDLKQCNTGLSCVNNSISGTSYRCSSGANLSSCNTTADCQSGLTCVNTNEYTKYCSDKTKNAYCDKDLKQCNSGLTCKLEGSVYKCKSLVMTNGETGCTADSDCETGLVCVNYSGTTKACSNKNNFSFCDKTQKVCNSGFTCINNATGASAENYRCTNGEISSSCNTTTACKTGLSCVTTSADYMFCSDKKNGNFCDKNLKQCDTGLTCVNNSVASTVYYCTSGANSSPCATTADCQSGLVCVDTNGYMKYCTNKAENSYCDKALKECTAGLTCLANTNGVFKCLSGPAASSCGGVDSNGDFKITLVDIVAFVSVYVNKPTCSATDTTVNACGRKDSNNDSVLSVQDIVSLIVRYNENKESCKLQ